jgi:uncharacterized protein (TIGR03089 family)
MADLANDPASRPVLGGPGGALSRALAQDPGRPFVTYYDDRTGARVELSVTTLANWIAKTANLLVDGFGLGPGDTVRLDLPRHWQLPVWALSAWTAGLVVDLDGDPAGADLAVCGPAGIEAARAAPEVVAVSLHPLGAPFADGALPAGVLDFGREVPAYGDRFTGPADQSGAPALRYAGRELTLGAAATVAAGMAARWGLAPAGRLLVEAPLDPLAEVLAATLVPLSVNGSVVLFSGAGPGSPGVLERAAAEHTTATAS